MLDRDKIRGLIETHRAKASTEQTEWDQMRAWYSSEAWEGGSGPQGSGGIGSDDELSMETNYPYAFVRWWPTFAPRTPKSQSMLEEDPCIRLLDIDKP